MSLKRNDNSSFSYYVDILKKNLNYVEDDTFSWNKVVSILIIKLTNTDSLNKDRDASNATQIQLTSPKDGTTDFRITEDFFPTLTLNSTFSRWRIAVPVRLNVQNVIHLKGNVPTDNQWFNDSIQIRRRLLNNNGNGHGNPTLHICYDNDLMPLRTALHVNDYLIIAKQTSSSTYEAFGVTSKIDLGSGKRMYLSDKSPKDSTSFSYSNIVKESQLLYCNNVDNNKRISGGVNVILYGVPGSGKSWTIEHEYCNDESKIERLVFHPDYMYSDFIGQILPIVVDDKVRYQFVPGPFTKLLKKAYNDPQNMYYLIIEEINRGNAPAIFGEVFQLLDRVTDSNHKYPIGTSEYGITNANIAKEVYGDTEHKVRIPSNLSLIGTMNTSDQNVFTLDTAFQRRWIMRMIQNSFKNHAFAQKTILDTTVTWENFCYAINNEILRMRNVTSSEDKRLGAYFISESDLGPLIDESALADNPEEQIKAHHKNSIFAEKVLKYLWDDAFKFNHNDIFNSKQHKSLESLIDGFMLAKGNKRFNVFNENLRKAIINGINEEGDAVHDNDSNE